MTEERCVCCGEIIPEGLQVCFNCEPKIEKHVSFSKGECFRCKKCPPEVITTWHEPLMGRKYKRLSEKYGLRVPLCFPGCHEYAQEEPSQEYNRYLQKLMQRKFEREYPHLSFMSIFGRNYL
jgi:hypothetical protein